MADHHQPTTVHVTARVPFELAKAFEQIAVAEDRSVSAELRRIMRHHVDAVAGRDVAPVDRRHATC